MPDFGGHRTEYPRNEFRKVDSFRDDYSRDDYRRQESHRDDYKRQESHRDDYKRQESRGDDYRRQESHVDDDERDDYRRQESYRDDNERDDYRRQDSYVDDDERDDYRRQDSYRDDNGREDYRRQDSFRDENERGEYRRQYSFRDENVRDDFNRQDSYRDENGRWQDRNQEGQRRQEYAKNGGPAGIDQRNNGDNYRTNRSRSSEPCTYELDHLLTLNINNSNIREPEDGLERLKHIEMTAGIWIMHVYMRIENYDIVIINQTTNKELERFPLDLINKPTASLSDDPRDLFGNLLILSVLEDDQNRSPPEMHIFQALNNSAGDLVDDIIEAKQNMGMNGPPRMQRDSYAQSTDAPASFYQYEENARRTARAVAAYEPPQANFAQDQYSNRRPDDPRSNGGVEPRFQSSDSDCHRPGYITDEMDRNEQLLNHCTDDIEKFVSLLQYTANVFRELESRKNGRHNNGYKDGMMSMRARPPPDKDFVDILQKFKLSLNLIASLKNDLYNPNASELIHFLFTPLSLVIESSKDPTHGTINIASNVVSPLLTKEAINLLKNCLTSQETALWVSLGSAWNTSSDQWKQQVATFVPRFADGWCPNPSWFTDTFETDRDRVKVTKDKRAAQSPVPSEPQWVNQRHKSARKSSRRLEQSVPAVSEQRPRDVDPSFPSRRQNLQPSPVPDTVIDDIHPTPIQWQNDQQKFKSTLISQGAKFIRAMHERIGRNKKELNVKNGEIFEILNDKLNWYKLRNYKSEVGHVPYTILEGATGPW